MNRYELSATRSDEGSMLLQFMRRAYPTAPRWQLLKSLKAGDIRLNGLRLRENTLLKQGDRLIWYTPWVPAEPPIVYEDENILLINKPSGMNSDEQPDGLSALAWAEGYSQGVFQPGLVHRLDNQTSGLLLLAKNEPAQLLLLQAFKERRVDKRYECRALGEFEVLQAEHHAWLLKRPKSARVEVYDHPRPGAREIITAYKVLSQGEGTSRLEIRPRTGRTHQIRAHLAHLGHPILGDDRYGDYAANKRYKAGRLMLAATALRFSIGGMLGYLDEREFSITAPLWGREEE